MKLEDYGWDPSWETSFQMYYQQGLEPARVTAEYEKIYELIGHHGSHKAAVAGHFVYTATGRSDYPSVGDWVAIERARDQVRIHAVIPRRTALSRKIAGVTTEEQIMAANVDTVFVVTGLDHDFSVRRLERYLTICSRSGARIVLILNKVDLQPDTSELESEVRRLAPGTPIHAVSAREDRGIDALDRYLKAGQTMVVIGSSGTGKSTLINRLSGAGLATYAVRDDDSRGRHTTRNRIMIPLPRGGVIIDSPGLREIQLWADQEDLAAAFPEIEALSQDCRFRDCRHRDEPGCAIHKALDDGRLEPARFASFQKLQEEVARLGKNRAEMRQERKDWGKKIAAISKTQKRRREMGLR